MAPVHRKLFDICNEKQNLIAAKFLNRPLPEMEWNVSDYLEITMEEMMGKETKKRIFVNVPLTFDRPNGLKFSKQDDLVSEFFEFA